MVQPINYSMDVLGPIEGYLQGIRFGEGINTERLGQEATRQNMGIQREQMDLAQAQFAAQERARAQQMAAAQAQQEQAQAGRDALMGYLTKLEEGTATPADLRRGMAAFPQLADQFQAFASSVSEERLNNEVGFGKQLAFALANDNVDAAANLLRTRQEAAEAAGDAQGAAVYKAQLLELEQNPNGLLMQTLMPLVNTMGEDFDEFHNDVLGLGGDASKPQSAIAKLQSDLAAGLINQSQYDLAVANMAPAGMEIVSDGAGGFTFRQGAGVDGSNDGGLEPSSPQAMVDSINGILEDPALDIATGWLAWTQNIPGTEARRFGARARQLEGQAFLQAFESLKGAGQITEIEGIKATQAIGRLDTAQSPEDYRDAVTELRDLLELGIERGQQDTQQSGGGNYTAEPTRLKFNPETGEFE